MTKIKRQYKKSVKRAKNSAGKKPKKNDMVGGSYYALNSKRSGKGAGKGVVKKVAKGIAGGVKKVVKKVGQKVSNKVDEIGAKRMVKKINKRNGGGSNTKSKNPRFL
jgi:beta-glucosidase/6-phospho-beta-glucosidase/beta-galactosidase